MTNKLQLPFSSLAEEFKVTSARKLMLYRDSIETKVSSAGIKVRIGRKTGGHGQDLDRALEVRTTPTQISDPVNVLCPYKPIKPLLLGSCRHSSMSTVPEERVP